jgi:hypothetical protein
MDAQQAAALRKPFDDSVIGKLPRSVCRQCSDSPRKRCDSHTWVSHCSECKGSHTSAVIHLDYVGHAATTDRLLAVDPEWSWEPLGLDAQGLPALDRSNNLWIKLTVCGVTRIGVGDGKSAKECIGDAIRNAAMRFGVALDLWAKEDLQEGRQTSDPHDAEDPWAGAENRPVSEAQITTIGTLMSKLGITDRELALKYVADVIGRMVQSRKELTVTEASQVIESLKADEKATA